MIRSVSQFPARVRSLVACAVRAGSPGVLSQSQAHRAAFATQPPQQPRSRAPPSSQHQQQHMQQQPRTAGQIVPPSGAAAPPPLPPVIEVTPESAEAIFSSSRSVFKHNARVHSSPAFHVNQVAHFPHICSVPLPLYSIFTRRGASLARRSLRYHPQHCFCSQLCQHHSQSGFQLTTNPFPFALSPCSCWRSMFLRSKVPLDLPR